MIVGIEKESTVVQERERMIRCIVPGCDHEHHAGVCVYAFDVDETLELSNGPVKLAMIDELRELGHIVGICGNMHVFCAVKDWHKRISFLGQSFLPKEVFLHGLRLNIRADDYVMVGNIPGRRNSLGFVTQSNCIEAAQKSGWRFIVEDDFAKGAR